MPDRGEGQLARLLRHLSADRRKQLMMICILTPVTAVVEMLAIASLVPFLALLEPGRDPHSALAGLLHWMDSLLPGPIAAGAAILFGFAAVVTAICRLALSWLSFRFTADLGHELNVEIQRRILHQSYLFHVSSHSSRLIASMDKVDELAFGYVLQGIRAVSAGVIAAALVVALLLVDARSAAAAIALVGTLYGLALLFVRERLSSHSVSASGAHQVRVQHAQEIVAGIRDIILDHSQHSHIRQFRTVDRPYMRSRTQIAFLSTAPRYIVEGVGLGLVAFISLIAAAHYGGIAFALPTLGALALGAMRLLPLASQLYGGWVSAVASRPILGEVNALLELPLATEVSLREPLALRQSIRFEDIGFHYPGRSTAALSGISFTIQRGNKVAIVGSSGSGKSTCADLLMGLLEPTSGQIRIDGELLAGSALSAWRRSVAHVPQSIFVADTTLARNISLALPNETIDQERLRRAAKIAQLDQFVDSLPAGYQTQAGEGGVGLSGGQRQRLALARAIYKQPQLLVLDEATSALDEETEASLLAALDEVQSSGCTIVTIAHRLSTVQRCDRIFLLDGGTLVQTGSFPEMFGRLNQLHDKGEL